MSDLPHKRSFNLPYFSGINYGLYASRPLKRGPGPYSYFASKRVRPLLLQPEKPMEIQKQPAPGFEAAIGGANALADDILFDLHSLLSEGPRQDPKKVQQYLDEEAMEEIDPDDPKRLLRIS